MRLSLLLSGLLAAFTVVPASAQKTKTDTGWKYNDRATGSKAPAGRDPMSALKKAGTAFRGELDNFVRAGGGAFTIGAYEGRDSLSLPAQRRIAITSFYIARTEVTNKEYRAFMQWVADSAARTGAGSDPATLRYRISTDAAVAVYPDTLSWVNDFSYSYNEPMTRYYFSHPAFNNYPVVGVSRPQAMAYCAWKTARWNEALRASGDTLRVELRLPTGAEWEVAAALPAEKSNQELSRPALRLNDGKERRLPKNEQLPLAGSNKGFLANFGTILDTNLFRAKDYADDGAFYAAPVRSYPANGRGLYDMAGNVAEWILDGGSFSYQRNPGSSEKPFSRLADSEWGPWTLAPGSPLLPLSPEEAGRYLQRYGIVKGGSWASGPFYLQPGVNQYHRPEEAHSFIGFRTVLYFVR